MGLFPGHQKQCPGNKPAIKNQVQQMDVWSHDRADRLERLKRLDGMKE